MALLLQYHKYVHGWYNWYISSTYIPVAVLLRITLTLCWKCPLYIVVALENLSWKLAEQQESFPPLICSLEGMHDNDCQQSVAKHTSWSFENSIPLETLAITSVLSTHTPGTSKNNVLYQRELFFSYSTKSCFPQQACWVPIPSPDSEPYL